MSPVIVKEPSSINVKKSVLEFTLDRAGENAVEILELSYQDIPWSWICGTLTRSCVLNGAKKPEGCALGLIGMNSGMAMFSVKELTEWNAQLKIDVPTGVYEVSGNFEQSDLYSTPKTAEAIACLAMAIPKEHIIGKHGWSTETDEAFDQWSENIPHNVSHAADEVVSYNDNELTRGQAAAWFCNAIGIANQRKIDGKQADLWVDEGCDCEDCQSPDYEGDDGS